MCEQRQAALPQVQFQRKHEPQSQLGAACGVSRSCVRREEILELAIKP
jgi:hypothetical protein